MVVFNAKLINESIKFNKEEILDVKWLTYDEINKKMLRGNYVKKAIANYQNKLIAPIDMVDVLKNERINQL